jgi:sugar lactone lactonase YvrE
VTCCFSRKKYPLDGSDAEVIIADVLLPTGIAIDPESDHLYFVDNNHNGTLLVYINKTSQGKT